MSTARERLMHCWQGLDKWWMDDNIQDMDEVTELRYADGYIQALLAVLDTVVKIPESLIDGVEILVENIDSLFEPLLEPLTDTTL